MNALERSTLLAGLIVFMASLQFGTNLLGAGIASLAAIVLGAICTLIWVHFDLPHRQIWIPPVSLGAASLLAVGIAALVRPISTLFVLVPILVAGSSFATLAFLTWDRPRCGLCSRRLRTQSVVFQCPRCKLEVCEESCWSFEHRRCHLCLEQRVPILPMQERWWSRVTGPPSEVGRCQVCLAAAQRAALRCCPKCRRLQCQDCWDFHNGSCTRCGESLPDLPSALTESIAKVYDRKAS